MEVVGEIGSFLNLYSDGSVHRSPHPIAPASSQFTNGVASKDVIINPETGIWARIFLPETASRKLPMLIYFHGGGFAICSTAWVEYDTFLHSLCRAAGVIIVSVDYRLAPEHRLPMAYDDCTEAVEWVRRQYAEATEEWLSPSVVDFSRCFIGGESAGGNIVYHIGLRVANMDMGMLSVKGLIVIHPAFGGEETVESEKGAEKAKFVETTDFIWSLCLPVGSNKDHPFCNPAVSSLTPGLKLPPVLVAVAGKDALKDRGVMFYEYLRSCGKEAELMEEESGIHAYPIMLPEFEGTVRLIHRISNFVVEH